MNDTLPVEFQMWDAEDCGGYFGCKREHFLRIKRYAEGFPAPLASSDAKRPRWSAKAVIDWALR